MPHSALGFAPTLAVIDGIPTVLSTDVASHFGKQHKDVLRAIEILRAELPSDFNERNFAPVDYQDAKGERRPAYRLTRDGFTLLAMGFTGKKALTFKLAYIAAFNEMEAALATQVLELPAIDVKALMLSGYATPQLPLPSSVAEALEQKAVELALEAHAIIRKHIARRVAYSCEVGMPRRVHEERALNVIEESTLGQALAARHYQEVDHVIFSLRHAANQADAAREKLLALRAHNVKKVTGHGNQ